MALPFTFAICRASLKTWFLLTMILPYRRRALPQAKDDISPDVIGEMRLRAPTFEAASTAGLRRYVLFECRVDACIASKKNDSPCKCLCLRLSFAAEPCRCATAGLMLRSQSVRPPMSMRLHLHLIRCARRRCGWPWCKPVRLCSSRPRCRPTRGAFCFAWLIFGNV